MNNSNPKYTTVQEFKVFEIGFDDKISSFTKQLAVIRGQLTEREDVDGKLTVMRSDFDNKCKQIAEQIMRLIAYVKNLDIDDKLSNIKLDLDERCKQIAAQIMQLRNTMR